ncbi:sugar ABC transporter permease [Eubacteriales bacterium mix99]|nr:sugar ABC transporter permease [Clostridiales bacterium]
MIDRSQIIPVEKHQRTKKWMDTLKKEKALWLLVLPGILWYLIFAYAPMFGLVIAFQDFSPFKGFTGSSWVGLTWFQQFFHSQFFGRLIRNTLLLNIYNILFSFPVPIILALLLNEIQHSRYKKTVQTISYLPHFVSTVVVVGMLTNFLSPVGGIVNLMIGKLGGKSINFMIKPEWFRPLYIISGIWQEAGWGSIIYLAALSGIDTQLYEASIVDGANKWKQLWHISIPGILPTIIIMLIMNLGHILSIGYEKIILMYNTSTYETADVINTYVYRRGILSGEYSFGTAVGLFQSAINFVFVIAANRISKRVTEVSLW